VVFPKPALLRNNLLSTARAAATQFRGTANHGTVAGPASWFNHRCLYQACGDIPPAELEAAYYSRNTRLAEAG
jgi:putative transposase